MLVVMNCHGRGHSSTEERVGENLLAPSQLDDEMLEIRVWVTFAFVFT